MFSHKKAIRYPKNLEKGILKWRAEGIMGCKA